MQSKVTGPNTSLRGELPSLWHNRAYVLLFGGQTISLLGSYIELVTLPLLILAVSHSPAQAGFVSALYALVSFVSGVPIGVAVDRWNRKRTMLLSDTGRMLLAGSLPAAIWAGHLTMIQIYVVALLDGVLATFYGLAATAAIPNILHKDQIPAAMGRTQMAATTSSLIGPALGGALYGASQAFPFMANAVSYGASALSLRFIRPPFQQASTRKRESFWPEAREGMTWSWRHPVIRSLTLLNGVRNVFIIGNPLLVIVLAKQQHASPLLIGLIFSIGSVGGILGSLLAARIQSRFTLGQITIATVWVDAILFPLFSIAPNPLLLGAIDAALFFLFPIYMTALSTYRLTAIPDRLRGRVSSSTRLVTIAGVSIGQTLTGVLLQEVGPHRAVAVLATGLLLVAAATSLSRPIRHASTDRDVREPDE